MDFELVVAWFMWVMVIALMCYLMLGFFVLGSESFEWS